MFIHDIPAIGSLLFASVLIDLLLFRKEIVLSMPSLTLWIVKNMICIVQSSTKCDEVKTLQSS